MSLVQQIKSPISSFFSPLFCSFLIFSIYTTQLKLWFFPRFFIWSFFVFVRPFVSRYCSFSLFQLFSFKSFIFYFTKLNSRSKFTPIRFVSFCFCCVVEKKSGMIYFVEYIVIYIGNNKLKQYLLYNPSTSFKFQKF